MMFPRLLNLRVAKANHVRGMRTVVRVALVAAMLSAVLALHATAADDSDRRQAGSRMLAGQATYEANCARCHGRAGEGSALASVDFTSPASVATLSQAAMIDAVVNGHEPEVRSAWSDNNSAERAASVVEFIREAFMLPAPVADASAGRSIYAKSCSVCHGERGDGASWAKNSLNPPPRSFTDGTAQTISRQEMVRAVTFGRNGTAMMPFATQYDREQIAAVVDYIRATFMHDSAEAGTDPSDLYGAAREVAAHGFSKDAKEEPEADMTAAFPDGLKGDVDKGRSFYKANCAECHGPEGDGNGRRAYFMRHKPENFLSDEARAELNRPHLFEAIAKGVRQTEMPAWSKVLDSQQIADVAEYVFLAFVRQDPAALEPNSSDAPGWHRLEAEPDSKKN